MAYLDNANLMGGWKLNASAFNRSNFTGLVILMLWILFVNGLPHLEEQVNWNLNQNETATNPQDYWGEWADHEFQPSPENWRMPFYTITLDRFINGDPTNDEANGTAWEHDPTSNQFRFGGDIKGLQSNLDYIQGMGVKVKHDTGQGNQADNG